MTHPESEFTGSRNPDSPHPQRWTAADVHATECEVTELVAAWVRALQPDLVVETGSYHGHTALPLAQAMKRNGHGRLVSLEMEPVLADLARQRVAAYQASSRRPSRRGKTRRRRPVNAPVPRHATRRGLCAGDALSRSIQPSADSFTPQPASGPLPLARRWRGGTSRASL